jgi:DNA polymerase III subunit gamma/tau
MSNFVVSARKYRPVNFDTVVGQPSVANTLKNAIKTGHVAHAYLFCGPRGVGKTTCARIFAKTLNCFNLSDDIEACNQCESCKSFDESRSFNIHELDAASNNSVDDIRSLIDKVRIIPQVGKYSIYIIDEVHMLSQAAFNAFLKTLEEPPEHAIFILATTEKHKIIPTILSRCQIFDFHRIRIEDIVAYLAKVASLEQINYEEEALNVIALKAEGAMRDALSIFDQVASFSNRNITYQEVLENLNVLDYEYFFKITQFFLDGAPAKVLVLFNEILQRGFDGQNFLSGLASHFRDLLVCHDESTLPLLEVSDVLKAKYREQAVVCSDEFLYKALEITNQCELSFKGSRNQRLHLELALIRLSNIVDEKKNLNSEQDFLVIPDINKVNEKQKPVQQVVETIAAPISRQSQIQISPVKKTHSRDAVTPESLPKISIKEALNNAGSGITYHDHKQETVSVEDPEEVKENKPLSLEQLNKSWNLFTVQIREDRPRMAVSLKNVQPQIQDNALISLSFNNRSQLDDFNNNTRFELEKFLRNEMHNGEITLEAHVTESEDAQNAKLYTSEEKFRYLSQKYPVLNTFRQKLNLELE